MRIGVVGNGVVGNATALAFSHAHEVRITDRIRSKETHQLSDVLECDVVFLCLPTPQEENSLVCDTSAIDGFFQYGIPSRFKSVNFVLRSTVPIGYTRRMRETWNLPNLVHSPEFLTARTAVEDAANPTRLIVGSSELQPNCMSPVCYLYEERWPNIHIHYMTSDESEAVKLFQNSFSAVKIAYFNEIRCLSDKLGLDWDRCLSALLAGGWINKMHTQVPGHDGKRGYGGNCLPKDIANLADCIHNAGCSDWMVTAAIQSNYSSNPEYKEDRK